MTNILTQKFAVAAVAAILFSGATGLAAPSAQADTLGFTAKQVAEVPCARPGPNGTCIRRPWDKKKPISGKPKPSQGAKIGRAGKLSNGGAAQQAKNPCSPPTTSKKCRDYIHEGYKPKPRPKG